MNGEGKYAVTTSNFYGIPINMMHSSNKDKLIRYEKDSYNNTKWSIVYLAWLLLLQWVIIKKGHFSSRKIFQEKKMTTGQGTLLTQ